MTHIHFCTTNVYLPHVCDSLLLNVIFMLIEQLTCICNIEYDVYSASDTSLVAALILLLGTASPQTSDLLLCTVFISK